MVASYYAWDPEFDCITEETSAAGAITARYTQEPRPYGGLVSQRRGSASSYYHYDNIGTTRVLTNQAQSATLQTTYTAFGENVSTIGTTVNAFGFVGKYGYQLLSGLSRIYVRQRHLDVALAKWASLDPIEFVMPSGIRVRSALELYLYCKNNPVFHIDPSGLAPCTKCGADITKHLKALFQAFEREFARHLVSPVYREQARQACYAMISWAGWDVKQLAHQKWRFKRGRTCGWDECDETVTVNNQCYKPEHVNYALWGLASRLCFNAGFARTQTHTRLRTYCGPSLGDPIPPPCHQVEEIVYGEFTEEWAAEMVEWYRNTVWFGWIWTAEVEGRVAWTRAGYHGDYSAPSATVSKLYKKTCSPCTLPYRGQMEASIGEHDSGGIGTGQNNIRATVYFWDN